MKYDEFAFFNQQLAAMLREGVPLEGALQQLSANLEHGELRTELQLLEADLKSGRPLNEALAARKLPEFYVQMVQVGQASNDLPGVLILLADYYQRVDSTWTRLKGLMVYPVIVLSTAFLLSAFLTVAITEIARSNFSEIMGMQFPPFVMINLWAPPIVIGILLGVALLVLLFPALQRRLRWRIPAFKEARLAQVAYAMGLMLEKGGNLSDALGVVGQMERNTPASKELAHWHAQLAQGRGQFAEMADAGKAFPPLFLWMVANAGEDLAGGFRRTAEIYQARAIQRIETFLYAALPFAVLALGVMICFQIIPIVKVFVDLLNGIGSIGD